MNKALCLTILIFITTPALPSDIRLAVLDLSPSNVPAHYAAAVRDRIEVALYPSPRIDLLERNRVQLVLKEHDLASASCRDEACAVRIGRFLSATHVIVGNVTYLDRYTVTVRVVDVARGRIVYADAESAPTRDRIAAAAVLLSKRILAHVESMGPGEVAAPASPRYSLTAGAGYVHPLGAFTRIARGGYSVTLAGTVNHVFVNNLFMGVKGSFNRFPGKRDVRHSMIVPFMAVIGYTIELPKSFFIAPSLSGGGAWNYVRKERSNNSGVIEPVLNPSISLGYAVTSSFSIQCSFDYHAFVEKNVIIHTLSANLLFAYLF